jgi:hypothetical protein
VSDDNLRLGIGHVLFIDIVGYSKLLIEEQKAAAESAHAQCWAQRRSVKQLHE